MPVQSPKKVAYDAAISSTYIYTYTKSFFALFRARESMKLVSKHGEDLHESPDAEIVGLQMIPRNRKSYHRL